VRFTAKSLIDSALVCNLRTDCSHIDLLSWIVEGALNANTPKRLSTKGEDKLFS